MSAKKSEHRYGMVINLDMCIGCGACSVACMSENNIGTLLDETDKIRSITWLKIYQIDNGKSFPDTEIAFIPRPCQHCEGGHGKHSPCVSVCPATATDYDETTGIVSQIPARCIGCRYCIAACPYHARCFNWFDVHWPKGSNRGLSPYVSPRMRGVVEKCTFCYHRYQLAKNKVFLKGDVVVEEKEYQTACAEACPSKAIIFGDLNNHQHKVYGLANSPHAFRLLERLRTNTKVYYISQREWVLHKLDNYLVGETISIKNNF